MVVKDKEEAQYGFQGYISKVRSAAINAKS